MQKPLSKAYAEIREFLDEVPVIEAHEHFIAGTDTRPMDVMSLIFSLYASCDMRSVSRKSVDDVFNVAMNYNKTFEERYKSFEDAYKKCKHTTYNKCVLRGLKECWGIDEINKESALKLNEQMHMRNNEFYQGLLDKYKIRAKIIDPSDTGVIGEFANCSGNMKNYSSDCRFAFPLPRYHYWDQSDIPKLLESQTGIVINTLDDLLTAFENLMQKCVKAGLVCIKDQSAYIRKISYEKVSDDTAGLLFKQLKEGKAPLTESEAITLSNWLIRKYIALAQKYDLPMQLHTGHMSGIYNEITKANAVHLTSLLAEFNEVQFDLLHGNWPFMDEYLFIGKNYPNVSLDLSWVQAIDPVYCIELMKRAIMTVPHSKVIAFGGDDSTIEHIIGYLILARDNVAYALSDLVESRWLTLSDAKEIAGDWFYNNPNRIFKFGLEEFSI